MTDRKHIVTGAAGFIGSALAERLLDRGDRVLGIDSITDFYSPEIKRANLRPLLERPGFELLERDLLEVDWPSALRDAATVFHQAAQAGVRSSWGADFDIYLERNVRATQVLLEAVKTRPGARVVFASSSSVYGETDALPMREDQLPRPQSPYGVTKLAAEHLCGLYWRNFGVPTVALRYFTVYGPRQRPDMAFHRFIKAGLRGEAISIYGDGEQTRDFTFVGDAVEANLLAAERGRPGAVERVVGKPLRVERREAQKGDVRHTKADWARAREELGFKPAVGLEKGLTLEAEWIERSMGMLV
jgi:UDP-glucose 4-epimerase